MAQVGFGLVGTGEWARNVHIPNLLRTDGARIAALSSRSPERLAAGRDAVAAGARGDQPTLYQDYKALLADPAVDAVIVCTPNDTHEAMTLEALAAGKHVLCEKPLSLTLEGCRRARAAASSAGRVFQIGLELRYADVARRVKELLPEIGSLQMAHCLIWRDWGAPGGWRSKDSTSGGIYLELGVHYLDLLDWLVGGESVRVFSTGGKMFGTEITDHFWTTLQYQGGPLVNLGICVFAPAENLIPIEIVGSKGRIAADVITGQVEVWMREGGRKDASPARPADYRFDGFPGSLESLADFVHAVRTGSAPLASIDTAERATALALAAGESESSGRVVTVPK
jgi:myo-inositol 2-dehydrogenase / D-chiro-inositol 1-dehydrogenase